MLFALILSLALPSNAIVSTADAPFVGLGTGQTIGHSCACGKNCRSSCCCKPQKTAVAKASEAKSSTELPEQTRLGLCVVPVPCNHSDLPSSASYWSNDWLLHKLVCVYLLKPNCSDSVSHTEAAYYIAFAPEPVTQPPEQHQAIFIALF